MENSAQHIVIKGQIGKCGQRQVFIAFAPASLLVQSSYADVFDEDSGKGYQRPFNAPHSAEFRRYIQSHGGTTIPLTLNLRADRDSAWRLDEAQDGTATLFIDPGSKVFSQVDCQHRLGHLSDVEISLAFMSFIRLTMEEEREVFTTINSKAKGLSGSLIDANLAKIAKELSSEVPNLYIAMCLADDHDSPWLNRLRKGGTTTGMKRTSSLRMMNRAATRFLREVKSHKNFTVDMAADAAKKFWRAVASTFPTEWGDSRRHFIAKGVGIYSLMSLGGELTSHALKRRLEITEAYYCGLLSDHLAMFDWSHDGPLNDLNGAKGAEQALQLLRDRMRKDSRTEGNGTWPTRISS